MALSQIVVLNPDGVVLGAIQYDPAFDGRSQRVVEAIQKLADQLGAAVPTRPIMSREVVAADGNIWMRLSGQAQLFQPGWEEIGVGKWGQPRHPRDPQHVSGEHAQAVRS